MDRRVLTFVEIDVDYCEHTYGTSPCAASLGVTGTKKCFNSLSTCQNRTNFGNVPQTLRFAEDCDYLPRDIDIVAASIVSTSYTPATISLGEDLGMRATLTVTFRDHLYSDSGPGFDKYLADRAYNPYNQGTFWSKFRARQPYLRGRPFRWIRIEEGQDLSQGETHHFIIESFDHSASGVFTIVAKDVLKIADNDRAQAPVMSQGYLSADVTSGASSFSLLPTDIGKLYMGAGYLAIGGKEIVSYTRAIGGNDSTTKLYLQFNGSNNATSTTDSSTSGKTVTVNGNAKLSTVDKVFGSASTLLDGVGDYWSLADHADWTPSGNFTMDCHAQVADLTNPGTLFCHSTDSDNYYRLYVTTDGRLRFEVKSAGVIIIALQSDANSVQVASLWQHLAVTRTGNVFRLFVDGYLAATQVRTAAIPNFTSTFKVGASHGGADGWNGYIDAARYRLDSVWEGPFIPYNTAYDSASTDTITVGSRAQYNTTAQAHTSSSRVQQCLQFTGQTPAFIIRELLIKYCGVNPAWIPYANWSQECATYLQRVYTTLIADPVGVNALVSEQILQAALAMWWDSMGKQLRLQVLRAVPADAKVYDDSSSKMMSSLSAAEQPDKRLSEVWTFYAQRNPLEPLENETNYKSNLRTFNAQAASDYGSSMIKKIYSRWIPEFGRSVADRANKITLGRFRDPPRAFRFDVFRTLNEPGPSLGGVYNLGGWSFQNDLGERVTAPMQITRLSPKPEKWSIEAEEMLYTDLDVVDLFNRVVTIDADTYNFNLLTTHNSLYPVITDPTGITLTCYINSGASVGSTSLGVASFIVGAFPSALNIIIRNRGRIQGPGGPGGNQGGALPQAGGTALYTRKSITLDNTGGQIWGGAGGGAAGSSNGGGGGTGDLPGTGGSGIVAGNNGTTEAGGGVTLGGFINPGSGGGPGLAGSANSSGGGFPGAAGNAIDGVSYVTISAAGDRRGSEVN